MGYRPTQEPSNHPLYPSRAAPLEGLQQARSLQARSAELKLTRIQVPKHNAMLAISEPVAAISCKLSSSEQPGLVFLLIPGTV